MAVMMKCGHVGNAIRESDKKPVCSICYGLKPEGEIASESPSLSGRTAKCMDCGKIVESALDLPFFAMYNVREHDSFYCGCRGWN